jgi:hypothetical protein
MLIKLKAKVLLTSEEQMEAEEKYDLGDIARSKEWVWRMIAIPVEEVYKIIEYNKSKTIVQTYDDEKILVSETFEDVFGRWEELKVLTGIEIEPEGDPEPERNDKDEEDED